MLPLYETLVADSVLDMDQALKDSMRAKIDDELKKLDEKWVSLSSSVNLKHFFSSFPLIFGDELSKPQFRSSDFRNEVG